MYLDDIEFKLKDSHTFPSKASLSENPDRGKTSTPTSKQVGGTHYNTMKSQPIDYILNNDLSYCEANVVKYISRHGAKHGKQDLLKAIHYIELLIEQEYSYD